MIDFAGTAEKMEKVRQTRRGYIGRKYDLFDGEKNVSFRGLLECKEWTNGPYITARGLKLLVTFGAMSAAREELTEGDDSFIGGFLAWLNSYCLFSLFLWRS